MKISGFEGKPFIDKMLRIFARPLLKQSSSSIKKITFD